MSGITRDSVIASMQAAAERMGLDLEDLQEMINEVLEDCLGKVQNLKKAISEQDHALVKAIAHDIKGSTANYGLPTASAIAFQVEQNNEAATVEMADSLNQQFEEFSKLGLDKP